MKAITIQQPYAHLITLPDDHDEAKRVENRSWNTDYRGPIAIHAGKGRKYLTNGDEFLWPSMAFGAIVAVANLVGCVPCHYTGRLRVPLTPVPTWAASRWPWLAAHKHTEGPFAFVMTEVRPLKTPLPFRGAQLLFPVDRVTEDAIMERL